MKLERKCEQRSDKCTPPSGKLIGFTCNPGMTRLHSSPCRSNEVQNKSTKNICFNKMLHKPFSKHVILKYEIAFSSNWKKKQSIIETGLLGLNEYRQKLKVRVSHITNDAEGRVELLASPFHISPVMAWILYYFNAGAGNSCRHLLVKAWGHCCCDPATWPRTPHHLVNLGVTVHHNLKIGRWGLGEK